MVSTQLIDVLNTCRKIRNNNHDSGTHYLLGYLWACISEKEKKRIAILFDNDLKEMETK
jgi:hypothetical protein